MSYTNAQIAQIVDLAIAEFPSDHEFTAYGIHTVINSIHEILDRPTTTPQPIYNRMKSFKSIKSMKDVRIDTIEAADFIKAYLTGAAKVDSSKLADRIKEKMALAAQANEEIEEAEEIVA